MLNTRELLGAAFIVASATALPATDPNDDDFACFSSFREYTSSSVTFEEQYTTEIISTREAYDIKTDTNVPLTTLCDGRPRALEPYKTIWSTYIETLDPPETTTRTLKYTGAAPTCTIAETACAAIVSAFPSRDPHCDLPASYVPCSASPDWCFISAVSGRTLYYWPISTVSGDFCSQNGSTVFAEPTSPPEPNKVVIDGNTFTSPTNYLSIGEVGAVIHGTRPTTTPCGPPAHKNVVLPITESFYSVGYLDNLETAKRSFNFEDLAPNFVPGDVYNRQRKCGYQHDRCTGVMEGTYHPILPLPTELLNLEPEEWKSVGCRATGDGYTIKPVALTTPAPTAPRKLL